MPDRLTAADAAFLYIEDSTTPRHVGTVMVFEPVEEGFDHESVLQLIASRIAFVPRYRQRLRSVPGNLGAPVWVDDEHFDMTYHVRRSGLPRPGTDEQLHEFVARIQTRPLDRTRPLWEVYLVEGLSGGRFALVTKSHQALVDGVNAVDIAQVIVDGRPGDPEAFTDTWHPSREPSDLELVAGALVDAVRRPGAIIDTLRHGVADVQTVAGQLWRVAGGLAGALARTAAGPAPSSPLNTTTGGSRRFATVTTDLEDYRSVRARLPRGSGDEVTVHDVALATIAGGLRTWLLTRGVPVHSGTTVRALVPVSVSAARAGHEASGDSGPAPAVTGCYVDLPVGEPAASMRLHQVSFAMRQQMADGRAVGATALTDLAGFAPATLHTLGARLGAAVSRRTHNLVVTNSPGPQTPLYAAGAELVETFPVMPLGAGEALSIGLTSYHGKVFYGLNADRSAMADLDVLAQAITDSLAELVQTHPPRTRR